MQDIWNKPSAYCIRLFLPHFRPDKRSVWLSGLEQVQLRRVSETPISFAANPNAISVFPRIPLSDTNTA
jgi:hypothetical protein